MQLSSIVALALAAVPAEALIRFGCSQLVITRLDPLVNPGLRPSTHLHQIIGGNSFNDSMGADHDLPSLSTCTTCQFSEDFSNYWTAVLFFRARNGTFHRVPQRQNVGFESANGGMTVYYMQNGLADYQQQSKVTAFKKGFRMLIGNAMGRTLSEANKYRQVTYTCLETLNTRFPETKNFPKAPCPAGIMANVRFPTCWDGKNLDSEDHMSHMSYPQTGTFESGGACPSTHPIKVPQLMYETIWDTRPFNDREIWPEDGSQPFVWSSGDGTGFSSHGDYVFGWKDDSLQKIMDQACYVSCEGKQQSLQVGNSCTLPSTVDEDVDGWLTELPGGPEVYLKPRDLDG